ncbi:MAG TPA: GntR family transcriptional regulator [Trueperaceae bacterium]
MDLSELPTIKAERVTDTVYQLLKENIIDQKLPAGYKINPDELAGRLGVSRTPVHEALVLLATDGLVEILPRKGTFVTEFTLEDIAETLDVRRALELLACETVVETATTDDLTVLRELIARMEASAQEATTVREAARLHDARNLEFHQRLVTLSRNRHLIATYENLRSHLRIARAHVDASAWRERLPEEKKEHERILAALEARDLAELKDALDSHLRRSKTSLLADLASQERRNQEQEGAFSN